VVCLDYEEKILEYEQRILELRKELIELSLNKNNVSNELILDKINFLQTELSYLNNQCNLLKSSLNPNLNLNKQVNTNPLPIKEYNTSSNINVSSNTQNNINQQINIQRKKKEEGKDYEKLFGKSLMGVFASILIFIAILSFSTLILPYLSEEIKLVGLYIISFAIAAFGTIKLMKHNESKFYAAVSGCGIGAIYITLFLSDFYFKMMNDFVLYLCLFIWVLVVYYLSRIKSNLFEIIGQIGITISIILGMILCVYSSDSIKFLVLLIFFILTECVFKKRILSYKDNIVSHISLTIQFVCMFIGIYAMSYFRIGFIILSIITLIEMILSYIEKNDKTETYITLNSINFFVLIFSLSNSILSNDSDYFGYVLSFILYFGVCLYIVLLDKNKTYCKSIAFKIVGFIAIILVFASCNILENFTITILFMIPFLLYGFYKNDSTLIWESFISEWLIFFIIWTSSYDYYELMIFVVNIILVVAYFVGNKRLNTTQRNVFYISSFLFTFISCSTCFNWIYSSTKFMINLCVLFIILIAFQVLVQLFTIMKENKSGKTILYISNAYLMIFGLFSLDQKNIIAHLLMILLTIGVFVINSKELLETYTKKFIGFYICIKYTILFIVILNSFNCESYIISIACLLFAILSIVYGFLTKNQHKKSFRIYGLILSMISVAKLILIDMKYDSTLMTTIGFLICGILCFVISFIYNKLDKKYGN
jgi:hypothetical protein